MTIASCDAVHTMIWGNSTLKGAHQTVLLCQISEFFYFLMADFWQTSELFAKRVNLFGLQFDSDISDLTSGMPALPALWQHRLPCGRVVVEHEMCGYCGPISLKILWSPPPETEEAIRK